VRIDSALRATKKQIRRLQTRKPAYEKTCVNDPALRKAKAPDCHTSLLVFGYIQKLISVTRSDGLKIALCPLFDLVDLPIVATRIVQ